jgi:hypothetical protein
MEEKLTICEDCTYAKDHRENPEAFTEVLGRFAASGFTCDGPASKLAPGASPFTVPTPRMVKQCGLDKALEKVLGEAGYEDTPNENTGRQMFFDGELELSPVSEAQ